MTGKEIVIDQRLILLRRHWRPNSQAHYLEGGSREDPLKLTIAISCEAGAPGPEVAKKLGKRLDWPVYDREILDLISKQSGLRTELLSTIDEHDPHWLQETITAFGHPGELSSAGYFKHLKRVLVTLATHGNCILVGRGATALLPPQTTLKLRIVEPLERRTARIARQYHLSEKDAEKRTRQIDLERERFIENHFHACNCDPHGFDLTLNMALLSPNQCADLILPLVRMRQQELVPSKSNVAATSGES